jgi:hypothetical protein
MAKGGKRLRYVIRLSDVVEKVAMLDHGLAHSQSQGNSWANVGCLVGLDVMRDVIWDEDAFRPCH